MLRTVLALLVALALPSSSAERSPPELEAPTGWLLQATGLRELTPADLARRRARFPFPVGERLVYQVRYFGVEVGFATLEVARFVELDGRRYAHLLATARTNELWSAIFRVDDRSEAFVDLDSGRIACSRTHLLHGHRETREEVGYDWDTHLVRARKEKVHRGSVREVAFDFGPFVYDVFDAFYALRRATYREGVEVELPVYASRKIHGFRVRATGGKPVEVAAFGPTPVATVELRPYDTIDGRPRDAGDGRVYVLADGSQIPVLLDGWFRFTDWIRIGGVAAELVSWEPGRTGWPAPEPVAWTPPPIAAESIEGRPRWSAPPAVRAARAAFRRCQTPPFRKSAQWSCICSGSPSANGAISASNCTPPAETIW